MGGTLTISTVTLGSPSMDIWALESDGVALARRLRIDLPPRQIPELQPSDEAQAILEGGLLVLVGRRLGGTTRRGGEDGGEQGRLQPGDRQRVPVPIQDKPGTVAQTPRAAAAPLPRRRAITALLVPT